MDSNELQLEYGPWDFCTVNNLRNFISVSNSVSFDFLSFFTAAIEFSAKYTVMFLYGPSHLIFILSCVVCAGRCCLDTYISFRINKVFLIHVDKHQKPLATHHAKL